MLPVFLLGHVKSVCLLINYLPLSGYLMVQKHKAKIYIKESYISKKKKGREVLYINMPHPQLHLEN